MSELSPVEDQSIINQSRRFARRCMKEFTAMEEENMTLEEVEEEVQARLDRLQRDHDEGFERPSWDAWTEAYNALIQVKQAQALTRIADLLDGFRASGFPVEHVS